MTEFATTRSSSSILFNRSNSPDQTTTEHKYWSSDFSSEDRRHLNSMKSGDSVPSLSEIERYRTATYRSTDVAAWGETGHVRDHTISVPNWVREAMGSQSLKEYFDTLEEYSSSDDGRGEDSYSVHPSTNTPDDQLYVRSYYAYNSRPVLTLAASNTAIRIVATPLLRAL